MNRSLALLTWILVLATAGTGLAQAWMRYLLDQADDFSAYNHPWQGTIEALHALLGPLAALGFGVVLAAHAMPKWKSPASSRRARIGGVLAASFVLSVVGTGAWLGAWPPLDGKLLNWFHAIAGSLFAVVVIAHAWTARRAKSVTRQACDRHR